MKGIGMQLRFLVTSARNFEPNNTSLKRTDFTGIKGVHRVYQHLKRQDSHVAANLLRHTALFKDNKKQAIDLLDVGGADGWMTQTLVQSLGIPARSYIIEPSNDSERITAYLSRANKSQGSLKVVTPIIKQKVEDNQCPLPKVDLVLASHSLYYNTPRWFLHRHLGTHLFTKLFSALRQNGVLCVILQSTQPTSIKGKNERELYNHEQLEDHIYPLVENIAHSHNPHYANAQMFGLALDHYQKLFINHFNKEIPWTIQSSTAITAVSLGDINTVPDHHGRFRQSDNVKEILSFYLKGKDFDSLTTDVQQRIIDLLRQNFQTKDGKFNVIHINEVYTIVAHENVLAQLEQLYLCTKQNLSMNL